MFRKSLLLTTAAVLAAISLAVGATFALFTDSAETANTFTAGQLCLESQRDQFDTVPGPMFYMTGMQGWTGSRQGKYPTAEVSPVSPPGYVPPTPGGWAPGDSVLRTLTVFNGSNTCRSMDSKLTRITASLHAESYAPLANKMKVKVNAQATSGGMVQVAEAYLSDFLDAEGVAIQYPGNLPITMPGHDGMIPPNMQMEFRVTFDLDTPNNYQDKTMIVDFTVHAEQLAHNP